MCKSLRIIMCRYLAVANIRIICGASPAWTNFSSFNSLLTSHCHVESPEVSVSLSSVVVTNNAFMQHSLSELSSKLL